MDGSFCLLSSLRYDPLLLAAAGNVPASPFHLLHYHHDRIFCAANHFKWPADATARLTPATLLLACTSAAADSPTPLKLRVLLSPAGVLTVSASPVPLTPLLSLLPAALPPPAAHATDWHIYLDTQPTVGSAHTSHKTTARQHYDAARARAGIRDWACAAEVVLWNGRAECIDGSFTSVYFWRDDRWITPALECGGSNATMRRWLLQRGLAHAGVVLVCSVRAGEVVLMSNGVRGVWAGIVQARVPEAGMNIDVGLEN